MITSIVTNGNVKVKIEMIENTYIFLVKLGISSMLALNLSIPKNREYRKRNALKFMNSDISKMRPVVAEYFYLQ